MANENPIVFDSHETGASIFDAMVNKAGEVAELKELTIASAIKNRYGDADPNHVHSISDFEGMQNQNIAWVKGDIAIDEDMAWNPKRGDRNWHPEETAEEATTAGE